MKMNEIWICTNNGNKQNANGNAIIAVSDKGRIKRKNGNPPEESTYKQHITINGKHIFIHRFLAEHFIPKTDEDISLGRNYIDHITHNPIGMNVNDTKNLRWCTQKENSNFDEARDNRSKGHEGNKNKLNKPTSEFGRKYFEHYGYSKSENPRQYKRECNYYYNNGKCRWEE